MRKIAMVGIVIVVVHRKGREKNIKGNTFISGQLVEWKWPVHFGKSV